MSTPTTVNQFVKKKNYIGILLTKATHYVIMNLSKRFEHTVIFLATLIRMGLTVMPKRVLSAKYITSHRASCALFNNVDQAYLGR